MAFGFRGTNVTLPWNLSQMSFHYLTEAAPAYMMPERRSIFMVRIFVSSFVFILRRLPNWHD